MHAEAATPATGDGDGHERDVAGSPRADRTGWLLLAIAVLVLLGAGLRNITDPWEKGMRGGVASFYSDAVVSHTLRHGLERTLGMPAVIEEDDEGFKRAVNWHHPPGYWLYLTFAAWLIEHEVWVLRAAQLLLFLPGVLALFLLIRRRVDALAAGVVALGFATCPLVAYYGPMVLQDGATLGVGLGAMWAFDRSVALRTWRAWWLAAALFFVTCSIDFPGYFWGLAMFCQAVFVHRSWAAVRTVLSLFPVSLAAFAVLAVHYGVDLGGPLGFVEQLTSVLHGEVASKPITAARIQGQVHNLLYRHGNVLFLAMAALGACSWLLFRTPKATRLLGIGVSLFVPGVVCVATMFNHALDHVFWSIQGFGGLATLAALPVLCARGRARVVAVALWGVMAVGGAVWTHVVISENEFEDVGTHAVMQKARPWLVQCATCLTSAKKTSQSYFYGTHVWPEIDTVPKLELMLMTARNVNYRGMMCVVVAPEHTASALTQRLDELGERQVADDVWVYLIDP